MNSPPKSFFITTLGCPKNVADSKHIEESLVNKGLVLAKSPEKSDIHLINTCTFIQSATEETIDTILNATQIKKKRKQKLVVVGCFAERYPQAIQEDIPEVDLIFGTGKYAQAGEILEKAFPEIFDKISSPEDILLAREKLHSNRKKKSKSYGFVKISDGCNRGCHFCIIPSLRGEFRDSSEENIFQDIHTALKEGAREICLVSQDTVFFGKSLDKLKDLIQKITELKDVELLRLLYLYPDKKTFQLLDVFHENPKIAPYLESPIQHVSEKILKSMNRSGNLSFFKDLFSKARQREDLEIRTSIILGYPNETSKEVDEVLEFIHTVKPEKLALFAFSPQEGTKAYSFASDLDEKEISRRVNLVREAHLEVLKEIHQSRIGKIYPAIVDEVHANETIVRRFQDAPEIDEVVFVKNKNLQVGEIGQVRINSFFEYDMEGEFFTR
jgi:ribosomal protein S12 methylthiotransferase